jgi:putative acyl-CoA dehydrogenase
MPVRCAEASRVAGTHEVINQVPPLVDYNAFTSDRAAVDALHASDAMWAHAALSQLGMRAGSEEAIAWGFEANRNPPGLATHDRTGNRIDEVLYTHAYHRLMETAVANGLHASAWRATVPGAHVARAVGFYVWSQVEAGHACPISMTHAAVPALRVQPDLYAAWGPAIMSASYDGRLAPVARKGSALFGMALTEKQGGSDVRANTTRAQAAGAGGPGAEYRLTGHKWFCSAPMSDAFLVLAQAPRGLSCFLVPRVLPDGSRNAIFLQRLKDKLGNRSNASSEVEYDGASAWLIGEEGRGIRSIVEMINFTRLDCAIGSASGMRQAVAQAVHHAYHRSAFGKVLADQALMQNVLADLALEAEAAMLTVVRLAQACDRAPADEREARVKRIGTALAKYWICKRAAPHAAEALECLGGNGYVEESVMPRLYREAPLNSLWEGAGNVNALDVLRVLAREPETLAAYDAEIEEGARHEPRLGAALARIKAEIADAADAEVRARRIVERMAVALQASIVVRAAPPFVAEAFCASRLAGHWGHAFGTLPASVDCRAIVERARPRIA